MRCEESQFFELNELKNIGLKNFGKVLHQCGMPNIRPSKNQDYICMGTWSNSHNSQTHAKFISLMSNKKCKFIIHG